MNNSSTAVPPLSLRRALFMLALIVAGESIFLLPFVVARIFRPTFMDVFGLTNLELGSAFSVYGIVAIFAYFAGGPLADRFSARQLMGTALITTALGGLIFASVPTLAVLTLLYGFWGLTTILLFWAAMLRATRIWGGPSGQGKAYGLLDGGRGLFAALLASISVAIFASLLPTDIESASLAQRSDALARIILIFSGIAVAVAAFVWVSVPDSSPTQQTSSPSGFKMGNLTQVIKMPAVWLQAIIIVCAYVGYKSTDDFSLYARDAFGYNDVTAAQIGTISFWVRPFAAMGAGFLGDKIRSSRVISLSFGILIIGSLMIGMGLIQPGLTWMLMGTVAATSIGIYALRGVYFAVFEEAKVPLAFTGTAVGLVSVIGFTPDVFMGPLMGYLLDQSPGATGHEHVFLAVAVFGVIGLIASLLFQRIVTK